MKKMTHAAAQMKKNGFTIIELLLVVAIIGILASIAIPNYLSEFDAISVVTALDQDRDLQKFATVYFGQNGAAPNLSTLNQLYASGGSSNSIYGRFTINTVTTDPGVGPDTYGDTAQYYVICSTFALKNAAYVYSFDDLKPRVAALGTDPVGKSWCGPGVTSSNTCNYATSCPCAASWKNHGDYTSCVAHALNTCLKAGQINDTQRGQLQSQAAQSSCGS